MRKLSIKVLILIALLSLNGCSNKETVDKSQAELSVTPLPTQAPVQLTLEIDEEIIPGTIEIEGMKETVNGKSIKSGIGYQMIYDPERFEVKNINGVDSITTLKTENTSNVYMNITRIDGFTLDSYITQLKETISTTTKDIQQNSNVAIGQYNAEEIVAKTNKDNLIITKHYYILETEKTIYLIELSYDTNTEEGYLPRLLNMLDSFMII